MGGTEKTTDETMHEQNISGKNGGVLSGGEVLDRRNSSHDVDVSAENINCISTFNMHDMAIGNMGERESIRPGDGFDAFLDFLRRPDRRTAVTAASAKPSRQHDSALLPSSAMRTNRNNSGGVVVVGHKPGPRSPSPPSKKTHGHGHGPAPPSPPPPAKNTHGHPTPKINDGHGPGHTPSPPTAKTTRVVELDRKWNGHHDVLEGFATKDEKGNRKNRGGLLSRLARRFGLVSHSRKKDATADDVEDRRDDDEEQEASVLSSISSNGSRESARSTILPYPFVAERAGYDNKHPPAGLKSPSSSMSRLDRGSVRDQCSVQYSASYNRSEMDGDASTWVFSVVGGGEIESIHGDTVLDGYIDVNDLLRNARKFDASARFVVQDGKVEQRPAGRRENRLVFI